ncbi:hypothetical protein PR202_ga26658 [Eleusine coracana subsp. coracana]|uniref:Nucleotidyl transferase domain-containing protein n=1 Tax=Eleusine coracana subsp. coracana TaxID=191504 RepID=A0AAV5DEN0_ELECO|nr:hypothetical protein PR202_ga26658 [Eleusine coracana subsp. coracana]
MAGSEQRVVAVIMVGGPTKGTRFRPLSLNVPKPLFPLAGQPMVHHPVSACRRMSSLIPPLQIPNLVQIYLVGFYEEREFALYVSSISNELRIPVRYLREDKPHGSAGGLYSFRDYIMEDSPSHIVLLNCDVCSSFPLPEMLEAHKKYGGMGTLLVNKVSAESANQFGELVADPETNELLHYTEKPETFIGPNVSISANARIGAGVRLINCIILDDVEIMGEGDHNAKLGITILGEAVDVEDEVVVVNSIVLPNKTLNVSVQEEIIL